jgi:acyl-CoA dehydrogenase
MGLASEPEIAVGAPSLPGNLAKIARRIADDVAGPDAAAVDLDARFPERAITALKAERLLGALVPRNLGGLEASISDIAGVCEILGQRCASTALIYAMHQIQVHCLVRHAPHVTSLRQFLVDLSERQLLLASATTETGIGGDVRTSLCAVLVQDGRYSLEKQAPVISYGVNADGILVTARRAPDAASGDQVLVLCLREEMTLEPTHGWDALGFRGTCSNGYVLRATGPSSHVLPEPFATISASTMLPTSHLLWASVWCGIAMDALGRARAYVRAQSRQHPGSTPPGARRLADAATSLQTMHATVRDGLQEFEQAMGDRDRLAGMGFALRMNNVKVAAARLVVDIVATALEVTGMAGYLRDSRFSVERHLRDAYGAGLMISDERIQQANAAMLLVAKDA